MMLKQAGYFLIFAMSSIGIEPKVSIGLEPNALPSKLDCARCKEEKWCEGGFFYNMVCPFRPWNPKV